MFLLFEILDILVLLRDVFFQDNNQPLYR